MRRGFRLSTLGALCLTLLLLGACSEASDTPEAAADPAVPARVSVLAVRAEPLTLTDELPGRVAAFRTADIRPQVSGIIQKVLLTEGATVAAGTPLFQIDPAPFAADADAAAAVLARAEAERFNAQVKFERAQRLSAQKITSDEALNNATAALAQAKASVAEASANLARRKLELSYATIRSPIPGTIGQSFLSEGGLASPAATSALAVVQQIDQVYVDVRQSAMSLERLREAATGAAADAAPDLPVEILTVTGRPHAERGRVLFSDISVDSATGSLGIRILVPNPEQQLLPGMYVRARVPREVLAAALLVPQEAVTRSAGGKPELIVVNADRTGVRRPVELGPLVGGRYLITSGLKDGETIVVLGQDRVQDGQPLDAVPMANADKPQS